MTMKLPQDKIVVASHNPGKVREIADLLRPLGIETVSAGELDLPEPEETETTFEGNARLKAEVAAAASGLAALSDDSGLCVDTLGGAPGIFSARWAGPSKDFRIAMQKVEHELRDRYALSPNQRQAHFVCALCLAIPGQEPRVYRGEVHGVMVWPPRGEKGFGYDPVFQPEGHQITFGEMDPDAKHAMSHRARAFAQLVGELKAAIG